VAVFGAFTRAASIVALTEFHPLRVLEAIQRQRCTVIFGVPTMFIAMLNHPDFAKFDVSSLRTGLIGGASCPRDVVLAVIEKMGVSDMRCAYGLTEASPGVTASMASDSIEHRVETVGCALPDVEVKIVDPAGGVDLPPGREGELVTRGYHVMLGYYKMPEETNKAIREGWLHTGDLATMDTDGYVRITGRSKDLIIRGGENIGPLEIEEVLVSHPAVREAYVFGVPSKFYGQQVAAAVQLKEGASLAAEELQQFSRHRLADFKIPEFVEFVTSFPTTPSGKVQKYKLAEAWGARNRP
jgi:fatty-acyl-CoA synthase